MKQKVQSYLLLHGTLLLYSGITVCSKLASGHEAFSAGFLLLYGAVLGLLFVYALLWQQVLKRLPLVTAYTNKAVVILWGMLWGFLLFGETVGPLQALGAVVIVAGVYIVATGDA